MDRLDKLMIKTERFLDHKLYKQYKNDLINYNKIKKIKQELRTIFKKNEANEYNQDSENSIKLYKKFTPKIINKIEKMYKYYSKIEGCCGSLQKAYVEYRYIHCTSNNMFNDNIVNIIYNDAQGFRNEDEIIFGIKKELKFLKIKNNDFLYKKFNLLKKIY